MQHQVFTAVTGNPYHDYKIISFSDYRQMIHFSLLLALK